MPSIFDPRDGGPGWLLLLLIVGVASSAARSFGSNGAIADVKDSRSTFAGTVTQIDNDAFTVSDGLRLERFDVRGLRERGALPRASVGDAVEVQYRSEATRVRAQSPSRKAPDASQPWLDDRAFFPG